MLDSCILTSDEAVRPFDRRSRAFPSLDESMLDTISLMYVSWDVMVIKSSKLKHVKKKKKPQ